MSDASSANKQSSYATECILLAEDVLASPETDAQMLETSVALTGGSMHLLHCSCTKAKRVSHCNSHAETNACAGALPRAQMIALRLCEPEHRLWPASLTPMRLLSAWTSLNWPPVRRVYRWTKDSAFESLRSEKSGVHIACADCSMFRLIGCLQAISQSMLDMYLRVFLSF